MYRSWGDAVDQTAYAGVGGPRGLQRGLPVLPRLIEAVLGVLGTYASYVTVEPKQHAREIANWSGVTLLIFRELVRVPWWEMNGIRVLRSLAQPRTRPSRNRLREMRSSQNIAMYDLEATNSATSEEPLDGGSESNENIAGADNAPTGSDSPLPKAKELHYANMRREIKDIYKLAVDIVAVERPEIRAAVQFFLHKVGETMLHY